MSEPWAPLLVTAEVPTGYASGCPWSPTLDGILSYAFMAERLGPDMGANIDLRPVEGLPLTVQSWQNLWWYECGSPRAVMPLEQRVKHFHRRFNNVDAERWFKGKRADTSLGPHKNLRKPHDITVCQAVTWTAVGQPSEIRRLLATVPSIGAGWSRGLGRVTRWTVEEVPETHIRRPVPEGYARARGIDGLRSYHPIRSPARLPENQALCVMPSAGATEPEVENASEPKIKAPPIHLSKFFLDLFSVPSK